MARFLLWVALTVFNISQPTLALFLLWLTFNIFCTSLARFLLCVCACEIISRGTQHQELRKVKNENNLCAYACILEKSCIFATCYLNKLKYGRVSKAFQRATERSNQRSCDVFSDFRRMWGNLAGLHRFKGCNDTGQGNDSNNRYNGSQTQRYVEI